MAESTVQKEPEKATDVTTTGAGASQGAGKTALSGEVQFNSDITIYSGNRLPLYDKGPVQAFTARGQDKAPPNLFAMICEDHLTPRSLKASNYAAIINPSLARLIASGPVHWPTAGKQKYCFVYENALGDPLMKIDTHGGLGMRYDHVLNGIIKPMVSVLADMRDKDIVHGNIRPSNIFNGGKTSVEKAVLGECLSLPISYNQPVLYEPIERALTSPSGKGTGSQLDDLYSFGVTLAVILRHVDPLEGLSDDEIIERKIEESSYSCLLGNDRFTGGSLELLRGLLHDDEAQRWTLDELLEWVDGRRLSPKQAARRFKASRPIPFNGEKYMLPELLARDLGKNVSEAKTLIESGELEQWLSRALEDKLATQRLEMALKHAEEGGKTAGYTERLLTRISIALHPEAPFRYKNISVTPDGVGTALAEAYIMKRDLQTYVDFFMNYFITQWVDSQTKHVSDISSLISRFDGARAFLRLKTMGGGIEKCIYYLNPEAPCLSEKLQKFYVRSPEDMLYAYEKISKTPNRPTMFFDRHSIAFLSVKDRKNIDPYLHDLNAPEAYRRILAEMKVLASIQKRSQMEKFPGISEWFADNLEPVYERFHDRELRKTLKKKVDQLKDGGDLAKIVLLFDDPAVYSDDNMNFRRAMRQFHDLEQESISLQRHMQDKENFGQETGRQVAAMVAGGLATIAILVIVLMSFGGGGKPF